MKDKTIIICFGIMALLIFYVRITLMYRYDDQVDGVYITMKRFDFKYDAKVTEIEDIVNDIDIKQRDNWLIYVQITNESNERLKRITLLLAEAVDDNVAEIESIREIQRIFYKWWMRQQDFNDAVRKSIGNLNTTIVVNQYISFE